MTRNGGSKAGCSMLKYAMMMTFEVSAPAMSSWTTLQKIILNGL